ncbi:MULTISPECIES: translesion error-prone DNA polymerase V subunit UmuC [Yersinia]|uniref:translesion error-prone DNA polymerase V subunit UmuC n=1 Tax=Yersinia TaxID=629 RepID=UPI000EAB920F|nr:MULTISPECIES: translesion error-prone DNA polymerase V subunit UmuC [Yersinia]QKJ09401.1 translesion error-prone DNA polymerase V subunit UmuC [Yersinia massiliensis]
MYLLCDANAFYCACEQLFRPDLKGKPVIVLTNNDGACAALNKEAKFLGIKRGQPYFEIKNIIKKHNVTVFSSNYALYGNISNRVMTLLESMAPKLTIYSIDEAVMNIQGMESVMPLEVFGRLVQQRVLKEIGLNTGIGVAQTLTLMKLANYAAKKWPATQGVVVLTDRERQRKLMALVPVGDVWGVGRKISARLNSMGIKTALQLADSNLQLIRKTFGVVLERTCRELNGIDCISIENLSAKEQIIVSRSFGERVTQLQDMRQAVFQYAERAAEKLRQEHQYCRQISVFIRCSPYSPEPYYGNNANQTLLLATQDTRDIVAAAMRGLDTIWKEGYRYQKAGIILNDFCSRPGQIDMFDDSHPKANSEQLMKAIDRINQTGLGRIWFAGQGIEKVWKMRREMLSPAYTTRWRDLPKARL